MKTEQNNICFIRSCRFQQPCNINNDLKGDKPKSLEEFIRANFGKLPDWAIALRSLRKREGISQASLDYALGITQTNISQMELGKRTIGKTLAEKFADFFKTDYHLFL